ncbi:helix-turn-helix domain-containing protein [Planctomycetota bacterium]
MRKLSKEVAALSKGSAAEERKAELPKLKADPAEVEKARLSPGLIKKLRKRLAISQAELAELIDVSTTTVAFWEQGRNRPTEESKAAIVALRKLGRRDVKRMLEARG